MALTEQELNTLNDFANTMWWTKSQQFIDTVNSKF